MKHLFILAGFMLSIASCGQAPIEKRPVQDENQDVYLSQLCDTNYGQLNENMYQKYPIPFENLSGYRRLEIMHLNEIYLLPENLLKIFVENEFMTYMNLGRADAFENGITDTAIGFARRNAMYLGDGNGGLSVAIHEFIHMIDNAVDLVGSSERLNELYTSFKKSHPGRNHHMINFPYMLTSEFEFLAEGAENYYCSKDYRENLQQTLPDLYDYFDQHFLNEVTSLYDKKSLKN